MKRSKLQHRQFICDTCGNIANAPKARGKTNPGHVKSMYCYICRMTTNHTQVDEFEKQGEEMIAQNLSNSTVSGELIKITYDNDRPTVLGRELHSFLEVDTPYTQWFDRMCEYGFSESTDYTGFSQKSDKPQGGRPTTDHQLTVEMAKEISMLQRNERGKQARQYFIQLEKAWNTPEQVMARALKLADQKIRHLELVVQEQAPQVLFAKAVETAKTSILVGEMAKILKQNGVDIGQNRFFEWLRENGYLIKRNGTDFNMPSQRSMELGLFEIKETSVVHADGHTSINKTPKVTGKGQQYFINHFLGRNAS